MNFEALENAWAQQTPVSSPVDASHLRKVAEIALARRSRLLRYAVATLGIALVAYPALSIANFRYLHPAWPAAFWLNVALNMAFTGGCFLYVLRRIARHRTLRRHRTASVREFAAVSLAGLEAETHDLRIGARVVPVMAGLALLSGYMNNLGHYNWKLFGTQAGILAAITLPIAWGLWRDYRVNVKPGLARLRSILDDQA